jgi:hypothetical protein
MSPTLLRRALAPALAVLALAPVTAVAVDRGIATPGPAFMTPGVSEVDRTADLKAGWVRIFVTWSAMEPSSKGAYDDTQMGVLNDRIQAFRAKGLKVLAVVHRAPPWARVNPAAGADNSPPANPDGADYGDFMGHMAQRFADTTAKPGVSAWEIWNEPDNEKENDGFWAGGPDPVGYTRILKNAYGKIKSGALAGGAIAPPTVVTGGMVGNDFDFVADLYKAGAKGSFDAVGIHTDTACLVRDPGFYYRDEAGKIGRFSFTAYREVKQTMLENGDDKPLWMTEIGWSTNTNNCTVGAGARENPVRKAGVPQDKQAEFLKQAYACLEHDKFVSHAFWFSLQDAGSDANRYDHFLGLIDRNGNNKAAYGAFQSLAAGVAPAFCGAKVDRDKPSVTIDVPSTFYSRLIIKGKAADPTTKLSRIELWVDGKRVENTNQDGPNYSLDWFGSTKLKNGKHTVGLRAYDEANNVGIAEEVVTKADPRTAPRTALARITFKARKKPGRRILINARVLRALTGDFTEEPKGRLIIFFQRKTGSKWKQTSKYTKGIGKKIALNYKAKKPGRWRVFGQLKVDGPYKNSKTKVFTFKL